MFSFSATGAWAGVSNGDVNGDGVVNAADVVLAQRIAMGIVTATSAQLSRGDVAPLNAPDGVINAADVVVIQRVAMGSINTYVIAASAGANGSISSSGTVSVISGATATFTMTPDAGYNVSDVLVDGVSKGAITSYTFTNVIASHTIAASFAINTFTITASADANGAVSPAGTVSVNYGETSTLTMTPNTGYRISDVLVDGASVGAVSTYEFTNIAANHTIAASFELDTYTINASANADGTISPSGIISINSGQTITFTMTPNVEHHIADVQVDGKSVGIGDTYTFSNVKANHSIAANFALKTYTITATADANGAISPSGVVNINSGATTTFTMTPNAGSNVQDVLVDGASVGTVSAYPFANVTANHTIAVSFTDITPPTGSVVINNGAAITNNTAVTLTLNAADNSGTVASMQFSNDNVSWSTPEPYATSKAWTMTSGQGTKTVYAKFNDAVGNWSGVVSGTINLETITPSNLLTIPLSNSQVKLTWKDNSSSETRFDIERSASQTGPYDVIGSTGADVATYTDGGLTTTMTYYYRVRAFDGFSYSAYSNIATYSNVSYDAVRYFYDNVGRLTRALQGTTGVTYQYDTVGNLLAITKEAISQNAPVIQSISPDVLFIGETTTVVIRGQNFLTLKQIFADDPNLIVETLDVFDTEITATIKIPASDAPGTVNLTVTSLYGSASIQADMISSTLSMNPGQLAIAPGSSGTITVNITPSIGKTITLPIINSNTSIVSAPSEILISAAGAGMLTVTALREGMAEIDAGGKISAVFVTQPFSPLTGETITNNAGPISVYIEPSSSAASMITSGLVSAYIDPTLLVSSIASGLVSAYIEPSASSSMASGLVSAYLSNVMTSVTRF